MKSLRVVLNLVLVSVLLTGGGLAAHWLATHRRPPAERPRQKSVPKVLAPAIQAQRDQRVEIVGFGSARAYLRVSITPEVTGLVTEKAASFFSGKYVRHGEMLLRIDDTNYRLAAESARKRIALLETNLAQLAREEKNLQASREIELEHLTVAERKSGRVRRLVESGAADENRLDTARETVLARRVQLQSTENQLALVEPRRNQLQAEIDAAEVELRKAETDLGRCVVRSPFTGRVVSALVDVGERVPAGAKCGEVYGTEIMEVPVSVPASDLAWIDDALLEACKRGEGAGPDERIPARVHWTQPNGGKTVSWEGCVDRLEAGLEAKTRTATLVVRVKNPPRDRVPAAHASGIEFPSPGPDAREIPPRLDVNMFCKVTVLGKRLEKAFLIPRRALLPDGSVYVVVNGKLRKREVSTARRTSDRVMILPGAGLKEADRVVLDRIPKPVLGMTIRAMDQPPQTRDASGEKDRETP